MIHLYTGDGKGKTTAAMGLALRALGRGKRVVCAQFLKGGKSGEILALEKLEGFTRVPTPAQVKFVFQMTKEEKADCAKDCARMLFEAVKDAGDADVLVLDEICAALTLGMLAQREVLEALDALSARAEIVLTGRDAPAWLSARADYISEIRAVRHPYAQGVPAREGIEF